MARTDLLAAAAALLSCLGAAVLVAPPAAAAVLAPPGAAATAPPQRLAAAARTRTRTRLPIFTLVHVTRPTAVRAAPGGRRLGVLSAETPLGSDTWLWATELRRGGRLARVILPWRPNGREGWIRVAPKALARTRVWLLADRSDRRISLLRGRRGIARFRTGVGAPASPTPRGRFSVTDLVATGDPSGPYGSFAFGLSGHQPRLPPGWTGGDQLAIHGTNEPASIGRAASAGCLRVSEGALRVLRRYLRLGTPVVVRP